MIIVLVTQNISVTKLLLRVIDDSIPTNRTNVFTELLTQLKIALLGLKTVTVTTGCNALLEKKEDAELLLSEKMHQLAPKP